MELPNDRVKEAFDCILAWRADPAALRHCPVCAAEGLAISDHSARPYREWYGLACGSCGLDAQLSVPLAGLADH